MAYLCQLKFFPSNSFTEPKQETAIHAHIFLPFSLKPVSSELTPT